MINGTTQKALKILYILTVSVTVLFFLYNLSNIIRLTQSSTALAQNLSIYLISAISSLLFLFLLTVLYLGGAHSFKKLQGELNTLSSDYKEHINKYETQAKELQDKNWEMEDANMELEASYGQLQAIIEQLNEAEQKYHALIRNIPEIVCAFDEAGVITFINHVCFNVLGYEKSEMTGKNILQFIDISKKYTPMEEINARLAIHNSISLELNLIKKDGTKVITEAKFTNYQYNGINIGLQAIIRDITASRILEEKIIQTNRELSIINSFSKSLTSSLDIEHLSSLLVKEITEKLHFDSCALGLANEGNESIATKAVSGDFYPVFEASESSSMAFDQETVMKSFNSDKILKLSDLKEPAAFHKVNKQKSEKEKLKEVMFVPFKVKNKKIGLLTVGSKTPIKASDENLLAYIGNSAAIAFDNALMYEKSKTYFIKTIDTLIAAVEAKDSYTEGHSRRVSNYAVEIADKLSLSKEQIEDIKIAGILHDIGKIGINDSILSKKIALSSDEYSVVKQHPLISNKILYPIGFSDRTLKAVAFHHERFDGKGYPYGLSGTDISIEAQIISVADAYDAMTSNRSYREAMTSKEALAELERNKDTQFNPRIVDSLIEVINGSNQ